MRCKLAYIAGSQLVSTSIDCTVRFWDAKFGYSLKIFSDSVPILVASFLPTDPKFFLTGNSKSVVRIVNSELGTVTQRMKVESELRYLVAFLHVQTRTSCESAVKHLK